MVPQKKLRLPIFLGHLNRVGLVWPTALGVVGGFIGLCAFRRQITMALLQEGALYFILMALPNCLFFSFSCVSNFPQCSFARSWDFLFCAVMLFYSF